MKNYLKSLKLKILGVIRRLKRFGKWDEIFKRLVNEV